MMILVMMIFLRWRLKLKYPQSKRTMNMMMINTKFLIMTKNIMIMVQVLTEVSLEVGSLGEEVGVAVPLPQGEEVPFP